MLIEENTNTNISSSNKTQKMSVLISKIGIILAPTSYGSQEDSVSQSM